MNKGYTFIILGVFTVCFTTIKSCKKPEQEDPCLSIVQEDFVQIR